MGVVEQDDAAERQREPTIANVAAGVSAVSEDPLSCHLVGSNAHKLRRSSIGALLHHSRTASIPAGRSATKRPLRSSQLS